MAKRQSPYTDTYPEVALAPAERLQFMNRYSVRRADTCISCGMCESLCPYGVHKRVEGHAKILPPDDRRCIGPSCEVNYFFCVANCPTKSLSVRESDNYASMGDARWPAGDDHRPHGDRRRPASRYRWTTRVTSAGPAGASTSSTSSSLRPRAGSTR